MGDNNSEIKILIVDDDPTQVKLLDGILNEHEFKVFTSNEADQGLQMAMDHCPDVLILDVMMPVINGFNFCQLLKNEEKQRAIKVIMVTARDDLEDIKIGLQMGADAYLTKPINTKELLKTINCVLTGAAQGED